MSITWLGVRKLLSAMFHHLAGKMLHKIKNPGVGPLMFAEGFVIHEQIAQETVAVDLVDPGRRISRPSAATAPRNGWKNGTRCRR